MTRGEWLFRTAVSVAMIVLAVWLTSDELRLRLLARRMEAAFTYSRSDDSEPPPGEVSAVIRRAEELGRDAG